MFGEVPCHPSNQAVAPAADLGAAGGCGHWGSLGVRNCEAPTSMCSRARSPRDLVLNFLTWFHILSPAEWVMEHKWVVELGWDPGRPVSRVCARSFSPRSLPLQPGGLAWALSVTVGKSGHFPNTRYSHPENGPTLRGPTGGGHHSTIKPGSGAGGWRWGWTKSELPSLFSKKGSSYLVF